MEIRSSLLVGLFLLLVPLAIDLCVADSKEIVRGNDGLDPNLDDKAASHLTQKSNEVNKVKQTGGDPVNTTKDATKEDISNTGSSVETKDVEKGKGDAIKKSKGGDGKPIKEGKDEADSGLVKKDSSQSQECDSANNCTDEEKKLVACLRVPGNDSPGLSLLIQNKGKGPLSVKIVASDFVKLEETEIQLQEKENKKMKVTIQDGGTDNSIVLLAGNSRCSLDIGDRNTPKRTNMNFSLMPTIAFLSLAIFLILASGWMCITFYRKRVSSNSSIYHRLDKELPISSVAAKADIVDDGWDNGWDDKWDDDEEAPKTPSVPLTPSFASPGLAARRLTKDGWRD
ncbi:hypothetical protein HS088_TW15G00251 [Tripterygium wilfordii]|uniref:DUF7356 domain-containing protein n=1 Tax=Tripterygium wilfordii TaxID=458696 RepID=A0A7J7CL40_TRIWF|nr:uncharacterized protein LOC120015882 [Tripterygium wilfordii]XP_038724302.1 uncharacterized protein LOC120015882 [Tripterygium wilfordii]KAF5734759.1 hypothetical protein HS088_TW15G00251 [Tripterygium wilfordii]